MRFIASKRHNPCPICDDVSGDCRTDTEGKLILCHDWISEDPKVPGFRWLKPSKCGVWGIFVPDDGSSEFNRSEWERRKQEQLEQRERQRQAQYLTALGADERDRMMKSRLK